MWLECGACSGQTGARSVAKGQAPGLRGVFTEPVPSKASLLESSVWRYVRHKQVCKSAGVWPGVRASMARLL